MFRRVLSATVARLRGRSARFVSRDATAAPAPESESEVEKFNTQLRLAVAGNRSAAHLHSIVAQMTERGLSPDTTTANLLMTGYKRLRLYSHALQVYDAMQSLGLKPDRYTYPTVLVCYCETGQRERAQQIVDEMVRSGQASVEAFNPLIGHALRSGGAGAAQALLDQMQQAGLEPSMVTYLLLLRDYSSRFDAEGAVATLERMRQLLATRKSRSGGDAVSTSLPARALTVAVRACRGPQRVLKYLCEAGADVVADVLNELMSMGMPRLASETLLAVWGERMRLPPRAVAPIFTAMNHETDGVTEMLSRLHELEYLGDATIVAHAIQLLSRLQQPDRAQAALEAWQRHPAAVPTAAPFEALLRALLAHQRSEQAAVLLSAVHASALRMPPELYRAVVRARAPRGWAALQPALRLASGAGVALDTGTWQAVVHGLARADDVAGALQALAVMRADGHVIDWPLLQRLLSATGADSTPARTLHVLQFIRTLDQGPDPPTRRLLHAAARRWPEVSRALREWSVDRAVPPERDTAAAAVPGSAPRFAAAAATPTAARPAASAAVLASDAAAPATDPTALPPTDGVGLAAALSLDGAGASPTEAAERALERGVTTRWDVARAAAAATVMADLAAPAPSAAASSAAALPPRRSAAVGSATARSPPSPGSAGRASSRPAYPAPHVARTPRPPPSTPAPAGTEATGSAAARAPPPPPPPNAAAAARTTGPTPPPAADGLRLGRTLPRGDPRAAFLAKWDADRRD